MTLIFDGNATCYIDLNPNEYSVLSVKNWSMDWFAFIPVANDNSGNIVLKAVHMIDLSPAPNITVDARIFYCHAVR